MKKILHVFPNSLFTNSYLKFINDNFKYIEHIFVITDIGANTTVDKKYNKIFEVYNLSTFRLSDSFRLYKIIRNQKYDQIIIHSMYLNYLLLSLFFSRHYLKNATLTLWGGSDSNKFKVSEENKKYVIQAFVYEFLRKIVLKNFKCIASIIISDYEKIKKLYNLEAKYKVCKYCIPTQSQFLSNITKDDGIIKIQVGHSGSIESQTIESLDLLEKYKKENIQVYAPLSYGNEEYIEKVIKHGKKIFGAKFIPMTKLVPAEEFARFISEMDILVMNTKIQQGLGNIYSYFYAKKKVYLSKKGVLYNFFEKEGFSLNILEEIKNIKFSEFIKINNKILENNYDKSKMQFNDNELENIWANIFIKGGKRNGM